MPLDPTRVGVLESSKGEDLEYYVGDSVGYSGYGMVWYGMVWYEVTNEERIQYTHFF